MLLTEKYKPTKLDDILGNQEVTSRVKQWILNWIKGERKKPLIVYGPSGTGKTSIAYCIKKEFDLEVVELSASDFRSKDRINRVLGGATLASSLSEKLTLILVDDIDILTKNDRGAIPEIKRIVETRQKPVIFTAEDAWNKKLAPLRAECELLQMKRVNKSSIVKLLTEIAKKEGLDANKIAEIAENSNGDVRSAINDLQASMIGLRDRKQDMFQNIRDIFKAQTYVEAKRVVDGDVDFDIIKLWIDENIPYEYTDKEDIANAYNYLSKADVFQGRIKNTNWKYFKYVIDFAVAGVSLAKKRTIENLLNIIFLSILHKWLTVWKEELC